MPVTATVQHEGQEITVELPEGYLSPEQVQADYVARETVEENYVLQADFDRRFQNWVPREKAADDDKVVQAVLDKHKPGKGGEVDLEAEKANWRATEVDPLRDQLDQLKGGLKAQAIREAASRHFDDQFVNNPFAAVEAKYADQFEYDPDLGYVVAKNGDSRLSATNPTKDRPYADPDEFFARLAKQDEYKPFLRPRERNGKGSDPSPGGGGSTGKRYADMSDSDRVNYAAEHGIDALHKLMEQS